MTKKILSLTVIAMLLIAIAIIPASAEEVEPRVIGQCLYCGASNMSYLRTTEEFSNQRYSPCTHGLSGDDLLVKRTTKKHYKCNSCGTEYAETVDVTTLRYCMGR